MTSDPDAAPINPLPPAVILLALAIVAVELIFQAGAQGFVGGPEGIGWRLRGVEGFGFTPVVFDHMVGTGRWSLDGLARLVTYPFIHFGFTHLVMVLVFLLALGKMVGEVFGSRAVFVIFFGSAVVGALVLALLTNSERPLAGGYPAVYGLVGGYTYILRAKLAAEGGPQAQAFVLIGFLLFIQLVFGLLFGTGPDWIAEIAGFAAGYGLSGLVRPGGWRAMIARFRQR